MIQTQMAYRSKSTRSDGAADVVVIHCSDHRFQQSFREFINDYLKLETYSLLAIPGGGHFIALADWLPKFSKIEQQSLSFLVKRGRPRKVILIGHDDCLFFKERAQFFFRGIDLKEKQFTNLRRARDLIRDRFPDLPIEIYFAGSNSDSSVQFLKLD